MKAMVISAPKDVRYIEVERPKTGPGDVLVRVRYCGICGTDLAIFGGNMSFVRDGLIKYPVRIGHEWSGIVEETGSEVVNFKPGDRVIGDNWVSCGQCKYCMQGDFHKCSGIRAVGTVNCWDGAFAEYILIPARHLYKLPDGISLEDGALIEPLSIAYSGVKESGIGTGCSVLVIGTGPIGLAATALARYMGAGKVMLAGRKDVKLDVGKKMGADTVINVTRESLKDFVLKETEGQGVSVILETSGAISIINDCLDYIGKKGIITLIGFYETQLNNFNIDKLVLNRIKMIGVTGEVTLHEIINVVKTAGISLKPTITHRFAFDEAADAIRTAEGKNDIRIKMLVEVQTR
ncbi:MAG: alcohol dehydrogenase catalytic domain-containing protein [Clostridiales bacterium]|nr:alcohol dehydrogenase catalytic domain-containing protein [Clostridiales bacterium]